MKSIIVTIIKINILKIVIIITMIIVIIKKKKMGDWIECMMQKRHWK